MSLSSINTYHRPFSLTHSIKKFATRPVTMQLRTKASTSGGGFRFLNMKILDRCKIYISNFSLVYDGHGGEGNGQATSNGYESGVVPISFDVETLHIPPLTRATAHVFGLKFPPCVTVRVEPDLFEGCIDPESGQVDLQLKGKIRCLIEEYKAPTLLLDTFLTSEESIGAVSGRLRGGQRIKHDGKCRLVGMTTIYPVDGDPTMNTLLDLPAECIIDLRAAFSFY